jgi:hypothetical protein
MPRKKKFLFMISLRRLPMRKNAHAVPIDEIKKELAELMKMKGMRGTNPKIPKEMKVANPSPKGLLVPLSSPLSL